MHNPNQVEFQWLNHSLRLPASVLHLFHPVIFFHFFFFFYIFFTTVFLNASFLPVKLLGTISRWVEPWNSRPFGTYLWVGKDIGIKCRVTINATERHETWGVERWGSLTGDFCVEGGRFLEGRSQLHSDTWQVGKQDIQGPRYCQGLPRKQFGKSMLAASASITCRNEPMALGKESL